MMEETLYLKCRPGDIAPLVLLTGDPARVYRVAEMLENTGEIRNNREFATATGTYRDTPVSVVSGGIGAPSTAIAIHELAGLGARVIVRVGTMMGLHAPLESVVIPTGAVRFEGTSARYLPINYPAVPDGRLVQALVVSSRQHKLSVQVGLAATYDAFYPDMAPTLIDQGAPDLTIPRRAGVLSMDMESSLVFVLGTVLGIATAAICLVTVQADPHRHLDSAVRAVCEQRMLWAALDGLVAVDGGSY
jgi:uridine phosphorylase